MTSQAQSNDHLLVENQELRTRLEEAEELLTQFAPATSTRW